MHVRALASTAAGFVPPSHLSETHEGDGSRRAVCRAVVDPVGFGVDAPSCAYPYSSVLQTEYVSRTEYS